MNDNSNLVKDFRCPDCGEMLTSHVIVDRHATGPCDESFTGPEIAFASVLPPTDEFWTKQCGFNYELGYTTGKHEATVEFAKDLLKNDFADCTVTERQGAIAAFEKIMSIVEHDSPVYCIAAEQHAWLAREEKDNGKVPIG